MTQNNSGPTWYDILGIAPDASPDQIKAAWRDATDKFEPGSGAGQFRLFNEAADVLLDPAKRAEYDAGLGLADDAAPETDGSETEPVAEPTTESTADASEDAPAAPAVPPDPIVPAAEGEGFSLDAKVVAVLSVLAVASLVLAGIFGIVLQHRVNTRQHDADSAAEASAVAARALTAVLSYDYRHMDADRDRSVKFLTPKYRKDYVKTFDLLTQGPNGTPGGAVKTKAVVTATVQNTAVQDAGENKVRVLVFVNQTSVKGSGTPAIFQNRVVATMVKSGDDWLIDDVKSY
ncbi:J domain-containing protein [Nocardioides marmorisolisilvae]|uniref:J domain-containing protein n=1 Tax=Nocardioides marmorisolisilvae TaxID=1542737 RepID=A0A3N0DZL6_9ACTN|nr:J domain-containing protein [Nocardioides marmorisolisilvae]RNL81049.1 J domain-containing protein [Nocardioides marmorisolisilvae]